jgi:hypothetical protein
MEDYLKSTGNPNLKLGKIEDKGDFFEAEIQTKNGETVDTITINKQTGWMGPYMMGQGYYGMGPGMMYRGYGMGPGMMGYGYGMGYGMMGRGYGMGPGYGSPNAPGYQAPQYRQPAEPLNEKDAEKLLNNYLQSTRNPNLKLGKIEDKGDSFEAEIKTKNGDLVDKIVIDKKTGWMRSTY